MTGDDRMIGSPGGAADFDAHRADFDPELSGLLGSSLEPIAPPARVRDSLLAAIRETEQERAPAIGSAGAPVASGGGASIHEFAPRRRGPSFQWVMRAAVAAVFVTAGLGGYAYGHSTAMNDMSEAHSYAMLNQMQDVERASDTMPDGHVATLTWSPEMEMAAVTLPAAMNEGMGAESGKVLQVWVRKGGVVTSAGVYAPSKGMDFTFIPIMPEQGIEVFVTVEPMGGSTRPTGEPLVVMRVGDGAVDSGGSGRGGSGQRTDDEDETGEA